MASKPASPKPAKTTASTGNDVEAFLASLEHPHKPEILALRQILLGADPAIAEGIKWNAPSFRTSEFFATFHLRAKDGVQIILHRGAKKRPDAAAGVQIADPGSQLEWLGTDRASVKFRDLKEIEARRAAFAALIRAWIKHV
jgi:hypothetical protein